METCTGELRCLICRKVILENVSIDSQVLSSNASLLQDFLNCFNINYLDSYVNDLSTSCHLCLTCEQFIAEWSSIQTQMTQLTRRNAQLKATLSALLLSEHEIQERINNEDGTDVINSRIHNAQEIERPLLLHQTVDDIRNELRRKYSARVLLTKITQIQKHTSDDLNGPNNVVPLPEKDTVSLSDSTQDPLHVQLPPVPKPEPLPTVNVTVDEAWDHWECEANIPVVPKIDPLSASNDNDDEPWDHSDFGADDSDMDYLPSENDDETIKQIPESRPASEYDANSNGSFLKDSNETTKVKAGIRKTNRCRRKSKKQRVVISVSPKEFKYNGYDVPLSELELQNLESLPAPQHRIAKSTMDLQPSPPVGNLVDGHDRHLEAEDEFPTVIPVLSPQSPNSPPLENSIDGRPSSPLVVRSRRLRKRLAPASPPQPEAANPTLLPPNPDKDIDEFACSHDGCGKFFLTKRLLSNHRPYHVKIDCGEAECDWNDPEKKFNAHFKEIHLQVLRCCKHCGAPWESSKITRHEKSCAGWSQMQRQDSRAMQRFHFPRARARQEGDEEKLAEARVRAGLRA